jgi:hypothetical protein
LSSLRLLMALGLWAACDGQLRFEQPQADAKKDAGATRVCIDDDDCNAASLYCDVVSRQCVACTRDEDCTEPSEPRCDLALHRCIGCGSDLDCRDQQTCLASTRSCVMRCEEGPTEHSCPATAPTCNEVARICVQCESDADCRAISDDGPYCERGSGRCVYCTDDRQCPAAHPRCDGVQHRCGQCSTGGDCPMSGACDPKTLTCI